MKRIKQIASIVALLIIALSLSPALVAALPAPDANSVLILDSTVSGGVASVEATKAAALGFTPVVVSGVTWSSMTAADFATYRALILGDPTCGYPAAPYTSVAEANRAVWGPTINGNVIINGTDPVYHQSQGGAQLTESSIAFAGDEPTKTGLYVSLSCYYYDAASGTPVPLLDVFGSFKVVGQGGCPADSHIVATHPALAGSTDATLSNWGCSTHEGFTEWPSDFLVLAISEDVPSSYVAPDGSTGAPYIVARGETLSPILCGNGILESTEECDDGNTLNGDGCSAQCKIEAPTSVCGNGILEPPESCDDGNLLDGDGCSSSCKIEPPPVLNCKDAGASPNILWPPNHKYVNVKVLGVSGGVGSIYTTVTGVYQDEVVNAHPGDKSPDAKLVPDGSVNLRAERDAHLNGRVYHLDFLATDSLDQKCEGQVAVCVPHDQGNGNTCIDEGALYDSTLP